MRASEVLPVPRGPTNRTAWLTRSERTPLRRVWTTASWPTIWANVWARQRRYSAWCGITSVTITSVRAQPGRECRAPSVEQIAPVPTMTGGSDQAVPRHPVMIA